MNSRDLIETAISLAQADSERLQLTVLRDPDAIRDVAVAFAKMTEAAAPLIARINHLDAKFPRARDSRRDDVRIGDLRALRAALFPTQSQGDER